LATATGRVLCNEVTRRYNLGGLSGQLIQVFNAVGASRRRCCLRGHVDDLALEIMSEAPGDVIGPAPSDEVGEDLAWPSKLPQCFRSHGEGDLVRHVERCRRHVPMVYPVSEPPWQTDREVYSGWYRTAMASETVADRDFALLVAQRVPGFTPRRARELRARQVVTSGGTGGRGKLTAYTDEDVEVAVAIERAKGDPDYKSKFHRAVLIAYANRAPVQTAGLRLAWKAEFDHNKTASIPVLDGVRVRDETWSVLDPVERDAALRVFAKLMTGEEITANEMVDGIAPALARNRAVAEALLTRLREGATPEDREAFDVDSLTDPSAVPQFFKENPNYLVPRRPGGPKQPNLEPMNSAYRAVEAMRVAVAGSSAATLPRDDLDEARDVLLYLRHLGEGSGEAYVDVTDFEIAWLTPQIAASWPTAGRTSKRPVGASRHR